MKTTTYTFDSDGKMQTTVTDKPELTPEQYRDACVVITAAAKEFTRKRKRYSKPLHESEHVALMRAVSQHFQTHHKCTAEFSDWKVTEMTVDELLWVFDRA